MKKFRRVISWILIGLICIAGMEVGTIPYVYAEEVLPEPIYCHYEPIGEKSEFGWQEEELVNEANQPVEVEDGALFLRRRAVLDYAVTIPTSYDSRNVSGKSYVTSIKNQGQHGVCWAFASLNALEASMIVEEGGFAVGGTDPYDFSERHLGYFTHVVRTMDATDLTYGDGTNGTPYEGGNFRMAANQLARHAGAEIEENAPYSLYTDMDNVPDLQRYSAAAYLTEYYQLDEADADAMKKAIMENGAIGVSYYSMNSGYSTGKTAYMSNHSGGTNHAVSIIGWDDSYDKSNFNGSYQPQADGAWLIKNSWGVSEHTNGCFWMSYEEPSIARPSVLKGVDAGTYDRIYQYDGASAGFVSFGTSGTQANVYQAEANEKIAAVSFFTNQKNVNYTATFYKSSSALTNPESGTQIGRTTGILTREGYHTIDLGTPAAIQKGEYFSVVLSLSAVGANVWLPIESGTDVSAKAGQSYLKLNGNWYDNTVYSSGTYKNNCIKVLTSGTTLDTTQLDSQLEVLSAITQSNCSVQTWAMLQKAIAMANTYKNSPNKTYSALRNAEIFAELAADKVNGIVAEDTIDYENEKIYLPDTSSKVYYIEISKIGATEVRTKRLKEATIENDCYMIDFSKLSQSKKHYIAITRDYDESATKTVMSQVFTVMNSYRKAAFALNYVKVMEHGLSGRDLLQSITVRTIAKGAKDVVYTNQPGTGQKDINGLDFQWKTNKESTEWLESSAFTSAVAQTYLQTGAAFMFRVKATDTLRASKPVTVRISKQSKALKVSMDYMRGTIKLKNGQEFRLLADDGTICSDWITINPYNKAGRGDEFYYGDYLPYPTSEKVSYSNRKIVQMTIDDVVEQINLSGVNMQVTTGGAIIATTGASIIVEKLNLEVRTAATPKKVVSLSGNVSVPFQQSAPTYACDVIYDEEKGTYTFENLDSNISEILLINSEDLDEFNLFTGKWLQLTQRRNILKGNAKSTYRLLDGTRKEVIIESGQTCLVRYKGIKGVQFPSLYRVDSVE